MPSTKDRLEALENLLLFTGGAVAGRVGPRAIIRGGARLAGAHPYVLAATLAAEGYIHREEIANVARKVGEAFEGTEPAGVRPAIVGREAIPAVRKLKRKVSKANKAVKHAMAILKSGTKAQTGSAPGTLPAGPLGHRQSRPVWPTQKQKALLGKENLKLRH